MTVDELLVHLKVTPRKWKFEHVWSDSVVLDGGSEPTEERVHMWFNPLTAVADRLGLRIDDRGGQEYWEAWFEAGKALGLSKDDTIRIHSAYCSLNKTEEMVELRRRILEAIGLQDRPRREP